MKYKSISKQFVHYLFAAGIGYLVDLSSLFILYEFFGFHYLVAAGISFTLGLLVVYILSSYFVFSNSKINNKSLEIGVFALIGVVGLGILSLLMWVLVDAADINYLLAKILATVVVYLWNFFARRTMYRN